MPERIAVVVRRRAMLTPAICRLELGRADGLPFAVAEPGAHVVLHTPAGFARAYSVTDTTPDGRLAITVQREADGRGGSRSAVDDLPAGARAAIDAPRTAFALPDARSYLLVAGGIGITPIRAMFRAVRARPGVDVRLLYLTRSREHTAYLGELAPLPGVTVHHSDAAGMLDLWPYLAEPDDDLHVLCCGPAALMDEVRALTMHWRPGNVHFEDFAGVAPVGGDAAPFRAVWAPTGVTVHVPAEGTLLRALRDAGVTLASSCESGTCGTCVLRVAGGAVEHRDLVLTPSERAGRMIACVSRSAGGLLTVAPPD